MSKILLEESGHKKILPENIYNVLPRERESADVPVKVTTTRWEVNQDEKGEYIKRVYRFKHQGQILTFLREAFDFISKNPGEPKYAIFGTKLVIRLASPGLNRVTENELDITKEFDLLYKEIIKFGYI